MSLGAREVAKKRGLQEVLFLEWDFGNRDFGLIAARVKDAKPDLVWVGDIGLEGNMLLDAMKKIDYVPPRSEEHTSELQSLMRISYAVFCMKKKNQTHTRST